MGFTVSYACRTLRGRSLPRFLSFMTFVAVGSVAVGTGALAVAFCILDGFERELRTNITGISAHVRVGVFRNAAVPDDPRRLETLKAVDGVMAATPFLQREAVVITRDDIDGVIVKGVHAAETATLLRDRMKQGACRLDDTAGKPSALIGARFAERLGLRVGDRLLIVGIDDPTAVLNAPKVQCVVAGIYETGMAEYFDDLYVFTSLATAQKLFGAPGCINGYDVLCRDIAEADATAGRIANALGYPFDPRSVFDMYRNIFVWIDLQKELVPLVVGSLILVSAFNVISTLLLFVIERTRSIGILRTLGASRRRIRRIFLLQGGMIGTIGALAGCAVAFLLLAAQREFRFLELPPDVYYMTTVPIRFSLPSFLLPAAAAVLLSVLSAFIPAWLASRLHPVESIRFH
ncbi:MAG: ABC transporter permease [Bacteroidota bacterium]|nr:ABC transporter permease [Bacteroidota bacterium]